ncbi:LPXTG cell wall anchor domain-containing protein, partial [Streptococcus sp. HMSC067A03]
GDKGDKGDAGKDGKDGNTHQGGKSNPDGNTHQTDQNSQNGNNNQVGNKKSNTFASVQNSVAPTNLGYRSKVPFSNVQSVGSKFTSVGTANTKLPKTGTKEFPFLPLIGLVGLASSATLIGKSWKRKEE